MQAAARAAYTFNLDPVEHFLTATRLERSARFAAHNVVMRELDEQRRQQGGDR